MGHIKGNELAVSNIGFEYKLEDTAPLTKN